MAVQVISSPWRSTFQQFLGATHKSLVVSAPYITKREAVWLSDSAIPSSTRQQTELTVLTNFAADSVLTNTLELEALEYFVNKFPQCEVVSVPHLHAKVYISDATRAIVTSANLTTAALDRNSEYGVIIDTPELVGQISADVGAYARLGSPVQADTLRNLSQLSQQLIEQYRQLQSTSAASLRNVFATKLQEVSHRFITSQVGLRSAQAVFSEAILFILGKGPLSTRNINPFVQQLLPDLCDDSVVLVINGQRFGKNWKHQVRNAQQALKRSGRIKFDGQRWALAV